MPARAGELLNKLGPHWVVNAAVPADSQQLLRFAMLDNALNEGIWSEINLHVTICLQAHVFAVWGGPDIPALCCCAYQALMQIPHSCGVPAHDQERESVQE